MKNRSFYFLLRSIYKSSEGLMGMVKKMDEIVKYLRASPYRRSVLNAMGSSITSAEKIKAKTSMQVSTINHVLRSLNTKGLVKSRGMAGKRSLYETTALGKAALQMKNQWGIIKWKGTNKQRRISRRVTK